MKLISETTKNIGFTKAKELIFPLFPTLAQDEEYMVRMTLAEQLRGVAEVCAKYIPTSSFTSTTNTTNSSVPSIPSSTTANTASSTTNTSALSSVGYLCLGDELLPIIATLLVDPQPEVRTAAGETLVLMANYIKKDDLGPRILTIVLSLAHDDDQEEFRMLAAVLLNELADTLGPDLCYQFVTPEIICLAEDPVFRVRKAAAMNLDAICRTSGPTHTAKRVLPAFIELTQDDIWGVRKACAESMVAVSKCLDPLVRVNELIPVMERFINDSSKWVRASAATYLGPFIGTLPGNRITPLLLNHYIRMGLPNDTTTNNLYPPSNSSSSTTNTTTTTNSSATTNPITLNLPARIGNDPAEAELAVHCAFSFPAVTLTLGRARWNELRPLFISLSRDIQLKVRRPLSHSLHELARILGPEITETDLIPAMELYLRDNDEVKAGVIKSFASFLSILSAPARDAYVPVLEELRTGALPHNWRFRRILATQLASFATLFSAQVTYDIVVPFAVALLQDQVAVVREETVSGIPALLNRLGTSDAVQQMNFIEKLLAFCTASSYRDRLLFVHIAANISKQCDVNLFRRHFMEPLLSLVTEKVRNVRVALANFLGNYTLPLLTVLDRKNNQTNSSSTETVITNTSSTTVASSLSTENLNNTNSTTETSTSSSSPSKDKPSDTSNSILPSSASTESSSIAPSSIITTPSPPPSTSLVTIPDDILYKDIDEEILPMWIREDINNLFLNNMIKLAHDNDNEVLQQLPKLWIDRYRTEPLPNIRDYILQHAQMNTTNTTTTTNNNNDSINTTTLSDQNTSVSSNNTSNNLSITTTNPTDLASSENPTDEAAAAVIAKRRASQTISSSSSSNSSSNSSTNTATNTGEDTLLQNHLHTIQDTLNMSILHQSTSWNTETDEAQASIVIEDDTNETNTTGDELSNTKNSPIAPPPLPNINISANSLNNNNSPIITTTNDDDNNSWDAIATESSNSATVPASNTITPPLPPTA